MKDDIRALAAPIARGEKIEDVITRAAKRASMSYSRAYEIWSGRARRITPEEKVRVASALVRKDIEDQRREAHDLRLRITALESRLVQTDPDFHRLDIDALGAMLPRGRRGTSDGG